MKVIYSHPAIPQDGIELGTEYEVTIKGGKAIISSGEFKLELTKDQLEGLFTKVKE